MNMITLQNTAYPGVTVLSNSFIDYCMPEANGEFVKVYIYLLRSLSSAPVSFSLEELADHLLCTERDILRALRYWEKQQLLSLDFSEEKKLCGVTLLSPEQAAQTVQQGQAALPNNDTPLGNTAGTAPAKKAISKAVPITPDRIKELKQNEEIVQLLYIAEQYLGKTLTPTEIQKLLFFYDGLKFSTDLIEYLVEYCVSRNHKSIRYIETVAIAWAEEGISTVQEAKEASSRYSREYFTILKSLGITGRNPVDTEISMMDTWLKDYGFSMDIIQEACSRTVLQTGQPSFQYTDKILSGWKSKNVHTMEDIRTLDAEHKKRRAEKKPARRTSSTQNRFNNFQQRDYNFDEYEKRLLNQ